MSATTTLPCPAAIVEISGADCRFPPSEREGHVELKPYAKGLRRLPRLETVRDLVSRKEAEGPKLHGSA